MRRLRHSFLALATLALLSACGESATYRTPEDSYVPPHPEAGEAMSAPQTSAMAEQPQPPLPPAAEIRVGFLVPLSGPSAELGQSLLDAGTLALFDKYATMDPQEIQAKIVLVPKDDEGTPQGAAKAAEQAISEGAQLIVGPLYADSVRAVAPIAAKHGVNVLTFSNNKEVAEKGVFLLGFAPDQQVERVLDEAFAQGKHRIAALLPADSYGTMLAEAVRTTVALYNETLAGVEFYPPGGQDEVDMAIQRLSGGHVQPGTSAPFDALLIAEGGERLGMILARLGTFGITNTNVQLLGTGVWDDPDLTHMSGLTGGWFASSPLKSYQGFEQRFAHNYGYAPPRVAGLAYDAVALAATLAQNPTGVEFSTATLTNSGGYAAPANGIFRLREDGTSLRGLSVLEVGVGEFIERSPAPRSFMK